MNEIDEKIKFDNFLYLESDMIYYYKSVNKYFYDRLGKVLHDHICDKFEDEYRKLDMTYKINEKLDL